MTTPRTNAGHDANFETTLLGVSSLNGLTPVPVEVNPTTGAMLTEGTGGTLVTTSFDYVGAAYPNSTTETYTYKTGGAAGTTVATVTVVYVDATKANITSVTKA